MNTETPEPRDPAIDEPGVTGPDETVDAPETEHVEDEGEPLGGNFA